MTDRQFLRQLLLAYLVKQAAQAESSPDEPSSRHGPGLDDVAALAISSLAAGGAAGYAGYRYGDKPLIRAFNWLSDRLEKHNENLARKIVRKKWPNHPALQSGNIDDVYRVLDENPLLLGKYVRRVYPFRYRVPGAVTAYLMTRPRVRAGLAGVGGTLAAGGLGYLLHSLAARD